MRARLNSFSPYTKKIILKTTMLILLGFSFLTIFMSTGTQVESRSSQYRQYLQNYSKKYSPQQQTYREFLFYQTYDSIIFRNKTLDLKYSQGLNKFSDMSEQQFQELYLIVTSVAKAKGFQEIAQFEVNYYFDWAPYLPPPKNMRDYDASHIFAVVSALQFQVNKLEMLQARSQNHTYDLQSNWITLAEQQIIDCCTNCMLKKDARVIFSYLRSAGISKDENYPYVNSISYSNPGPCKTQNQVKPYSIKQYGEVRSCKQLVDRLNYSPVVVFVDARKWRSYTGGIFDGCSDIKRNHYALVVGRGIRYWKIRNSWGVHWGEYGHIRIPSGNSCGICGRGFFVQTS